MGFCCFLDWRSLSFQHVVLVAEVKGPQVLGLQWGVDIQYSRASPIRSVCSPFGEGKCSLSWQVMCTTWHSLASRECERLHILSDNWNGQVQSKPPAPRPSPCHTVAPPESFSACHSPRGLSRIWLSQWWLQTYRKVRLALSARSPPVSAILLDSTWSHPAIIWYPGPECPGSMTQTKPPIIGFSLVQEIGTSLTQISWDL